MSDESEQITIAKVDLRRLVEDYERLHGYYDDWPTWPINTREFYERMTTILEGGTE